MMEEHPPRTLPRALTGPARAMSKVTRILAPTPATSPDDAASRPAASTIVDCALYVDGVRQPGDWHYADALVAARRQRDAFVWVGLKEPGNAELAEIGETFGLHELSVEDAVKSKQRPKVERYPQMTFVTLRTARYVEHAELTETSEVVETGDMMMFIGEHFIVTVRHGDACQLRPVRGELSRRKSERE